MENNKRPTQADKVLKYMRYFGKITQRDAMNDLGCMRLASRIAELKEAGHKINRRMVKVRNRFGETCMIAEYSLAEQEV